MPTLDEQRRAAHAKHMKEQTEIAAQRVNERREKLKEQFKVVAAKRFEVAGGDPANFDAEFPGLWREHLRQQALSATMPTAEQQALGIQDY